jgi:multidrug efflux pump subunit AcrA (membrane-fusion protein)
MRKRNAILFSCAAVLLLIVAAAAIPAIRGMGGATEVPLYEVRRGEFVRTVVADGNLKAVTATPLGAPVEIRRPMKIAWLAPDGSVVRQGDVVIRFDPTEMENTLRDGTAEKETVENDMVRKRTQDGAELQNLDRDADLAGLELEYSKTFQSKDPEIFSRSEIIESEIDEKLATHRKEHATEKRGIREELSRVDMDLLAIRRKKAELKIEEAEQGLRSLEVRAPHDGVFVLDRDWNGVRQVGEVVWAGRQIAEIPKLDVIEARVYVLEADAGGIEVGCEAQVLMEAHPDRPVSARVQKIAALAVSRTRRSPVQYFEVVLEIDETEPEYMKPGQRVRAELFTDRESDVLAVPREAVFEEDDNGKIVYRSTVWGFEPVEVELGATALGRVVIAAGLEEGDVVALQDPTKAAGEENGLNGKPADAEGPGVGG